MSLQLEIELPIDRHEGDRYAEALAQYLKMSKPKGHKIFLCYNKTKKQFFVNWLFTREFLEFRKVIIIQ